MNQGTAFEPATEMLTANATLGLPRKPKSNSSHAQEEDRKSGNEENRASHKNGG